MLNKVCIAGRLLADPELRHTGANVSVTSFRIACDRDYRNKEGNRDSDFAGVTAWRNTAEFVADNFHKGDMILVTGRLASRNYVDKNNIRRSILEIEAEEAYFGSQLRREPAAPAEEPAPEEEA